MWNPRSAPGGGALALGVLLSLAGQRGTACGATPAELRTVIMSVVDERGEAVTSLGQDEVAVLENGLVREVRRLELDRRPLFVALVVDTSEAAGSMLRLHVGPALAGFVGRLPLGTQIALWTTGDRPSLVLGFSDDRASLLRSLQRLVPSGGSTLLDTLLEASRALQKREGERGVVVAVTALGVDFSHFDRHSVVDEASRSPSLFFSVQVEDGAAPLDFRENHQHALAGLAEGTDGRYDVVLSPMGVEKALFRIAADLLGQYRLSYASISDIKNRRLEVKLARPGGVVRVGRRIR